jgi:hypothetical protein
VEEHRDEDFQIEDFRFQKWIRAAPKRAGGHSEIQNLQSAIKGRES